MTAHPLVSLILVVKNGMPYLPEALSSVAAQNYDNYEVIVQDGASTDGTLNILQAANDLPLTIESAPDAGVGDAYNKAVRRCRGEIVGSIDADNLLHPEAISRAVEFFASAPDVAAAYGGSDIVEADTTLRYPWMPGTFDLLRLLTCELVPPFAVSFFSRRLCGDELRFDESLKTCADFDLWLRLSHLRVARIDAILGSTRLSDASMTRRVSTYDQYIADKTTALEHYLERIPPSPLVDSVRRHALAGIYIWAAESVYDIENRRTAQIDRYLMHAAALVPDGMRAVQFAAALDAAEEAASADATPPAPVRLTRTQQARAVLRRASGRIS